MNSADFVGPPKKSKKIGTLIFHVHVTCAEIFKVILGDTCNPNAIARAAMVIIVLNLH